jgi:serine/threonine-protein kinase
VPPTKLTDAETSPAVGPMLRSDSSLDDSRFLPGMVLAGRYRVVGLIGRGGMGEVYRADDMKLGQTVALKFLPEGLERDATRLTRFFAEVRIARQVTHPNVCRVYDTGEFEGQHFISMEYVDGEDLRSLLRRIGRLPREKAVQIARQLCAGVAAAHEQGILHRDLKPANVMVDGRGRVRITDFGLAGLAEGFEGAEIRAGTPSYMAPEQLEGKQVSVRSDIYALGLVLYELFTGKPAYEARTPAELRRMHQTSPPTPSSFVEGFDESVERVILRCLEKEPLRRPASALSVAAALPGGDPLAEALAAGETPSPEMVADAGGEGAVKPGLAIASLIVIVLGLIGGLLESHQRSLYRHLAMEKPPDALRVEAREILASAGHDVTAADHARGWTVWSDYFDWVGENDESAGRWDGVGEARPTPLLFWYRESPRKLFPTNLFYTMVQADDPPNRVTGMAKVLLDSDGRLVGLDVVPPQRDDAQGPWPETDWATLFRWADLDQAAFEPANPEWNPLFDCDARAAWSGSYADQPEVPIRVEAGAYRGQPVYFQVVTPWSEAGRMGADSPTVGETAGTAILVTVLFGVLVSGVLLARRNLRLGRGDRRGAFRIALFVFAVFVLQWIVGGDHVADFNEVGLLLDRIAWGLFFSGSVWVVYVALEPHARRLWPDLMISWSRLLTGRYRDPLVGRSILAGGVCYTGFLLIVYLSRLVQGWLGFPPDRPGWGSSELSVMEGARQAAGQFFDQLLPTVFFPIGFLFLLLLFRGLLRRQWAAVAAFVLVFSLAGALQTDTNVALELAFSLLVWSGVAFVLIRFGLLSLAVWLAFLVVQQFPPAIDFSVWYAGRTMVALLIIASLACYGFWISLAGRPLFARDLLADQLEASR